jgi:hypothetical protein
MALGRACTGKSVDGVGMTAFANEHGWRRAWRVGRARMDRYPQREMRPALGAGRQRRMILAAAAEGRDRGELRRECGGGGVCARMCTCWRAVPDGHTQAIQHLGLRARWVRAPGWPCSACSLRAPDPGPTPRWRPGPPRPGPGPPRRMPRWTRRSPAHARRAESDPCTHAHTGARQQHARPSRQAGTPALQAARTLIPAPQAACRTPHSRHPAIREAGWQPSAVEGAPACHATAGRTAGQTAGRTAGQTPSSTSHAIGDGGRLAGWCRLYGCRARAAAAAGGWGEGGRAAALKQRTATPPALRISHSSIRHGPPHMSTHGCACGRRRTSPVSPSRVRRRTPAVRGPNRKGGAALMRPHKPSPGRAKAGGGGGGGVGVGEAEGGAGAGAQQQHRTATHSQGY